MTDQEIIDQIRTGRSDRALSRLYRYYPMVRKMVRTAGGTTADAEDLFQEALIRLVRNVSRQDFTLTSKLSTYLFGISRLLWKEELRRRNRSIPPALAQEPSGLEEAPDPNGLEEEEQARMAERALAELGDRCRELLLLFYHYRLKMQDIASRMGYSSENTAKNQKYKCLEAAKLKLSQLIRIHQNS